MPTRTAYGGKRAVLTTMHGKGAVIVPLLQSRLGLTVEVNPGIDTDSLGTFTKEVARKKDMLETAIEKAHLGMTASRFSIGLASEGSFGPHPAIPFLAINREIIVLVDDERGIVVKEFVSSEDTNFSSLVVDAAIDITDFLNRAKFPRHAIVVSPNQSLDDRPTFKGIRERTVLNGLIRRCAEASSDGKALLQTDMRANFNPTRMKVIECCAHKLSQRILSLCPQCREAGWGIVDIERGLPCGFCDAPTALLRSEILGCVRCDHREVRARSDGLRVADQMYCSSCNP